ncbi:hypothetical protein ILYODFUR_027008 [Ilyodon furcidens]|uniref:Uncharacterized protein n=1 Tax=Ilyodon furcidens TaxID=33524 RepID=A0ABV0U8T4_9TELE
MMNASENSSFTSSYLQVNHCANIFISISWIRVILLLPLSTFVLYLGLQNWRQHRSFKTASHFDIITYHLAFMELLWVLGYIWQMCAQYYYFTALSSVTVFLTSNVFYGEILFHTLTCAEYYIAVVLPITYLRMKSTHGLWIRTISIICVWLLSFGMSSLSLVQLYKFANILLLCLLGFAIIVTSFCSSSVLYALIHPGPGEKGVKKGLADQSKQRAFHTITIISCIQWLWFLGLLVSKAMGEIPWLSSAVSCLVMVSLGFCNLPCCLVLPMMYLQRAGKLSQN